jgi:hypothetical protein
MSRTRLVVTAVAAGFLGSGLVLATADTADASSYHGYRAGRVVHAGGYRGYRGPHRVVVGRAYVRPAVGYRGGYYRRGWAPGAVAAAGVVGLTAGAIAASSTSAYGYGRYAEPYGYAYPAQYGYAAPAYAQTCAYVPRRAYVPGWGWRIVQNYECGY